MSARAGAHGLGLSRSPGRVGVRDLLLRSDVLLVSAALALSVLGALLVHSATRVDSGSAYLLRHLLNLGLGVTLAVLVGRLDRQTLRALAPLVLAASVVGLVLVLSPLGSTINGSRSWIQLPGGFSLQPSEFAKVGLCVGLPMVLADPLERHRRPGARSILAALAVAGVPILLVLLQPDLGSALVLAALTLGVVALSGAPARWLVGAGAVGAAVVTAALTTPLLSPYQRDRLLAFIDPSLDPEGIGYQTRQVRLAIGAGGWQGEGLHAGTRTQGGYIPFQETDFIFSVAGEELGFLGAGLLIVLVAALVARIVLIGNGADDPFGRLVAVGVATWFAVQALENIGMNLGMMPVTGLPLPFVS